jgi:hypothetical protein
VIEVLEQVVKSSGECETAAFSVRRSLVIRHWICALFWVAFFLFWLVTIITSTNTNRLVATVIWLIIAGGGLAWEISFLRMTRRPIILIHPERLMISNPVGSDTVIGWDSITNINIKRTIYTSQLLYLRYDQERKKGRVKIVMLKDIELKRNLVEKIIEMSSKASVSEATRSYLKGLDKENYEGSDRGPMKWVE